MQRTMMIAYDERVTVLNGERRKCNYKEREREVSQAIAWGKINRRRHMAAYLDSG
jgi:hypothetical protein